MIAIRVVCLLSIVCLSDAAALPKPEIAKSYGGHQVQLVTNNSELPKGPTEVPWSGVHIRSHSISEFGDQFRDGQKMWARNIMRTLLYRRRISRILRQQQVLQNRLMRLEARSAALAVRIRALQTKQTGVKSPDAKIALRMSESRLLIRRLQAERTQLQRRIKQLPRRIRTLQRRVAILKERTRTQLADTVAARYWPLANFMERRHFYKLSRVGKFVRKLKSVGKIRFKPMKSREDIKQTGEKIYKLAKSYRQAAKAFMISRRRVRDIDVQLAQAQKTSDKQGAAKFIKHLKQEKNHELIKQRRMDQIMHRIITSYELLMMRRQLLDDAKLFFNLPKPKPINANQLSDRQLKARINKRLKRFKILQNHEAQRLKDIKNRLVHISQREARLLRRSNRLRVRRRQLEKRIDEIEVLHRLELAKRVKELSKVTGKQTDAVILRHKRDRLVSRIRAIETDLRRLAERAATIRCRIRLQTRRLRQAKLRQQRFLRRLKRYGLKRLAVGLSN